MKVDYNQVTARLAQKIAKLEVENAILLTEVNALREGKEDGNETAESENQPD